MNDKKHPMDNKKRLPILWIDSLLGVEGQFVCSEGFPLLLPIFGVT